MVPSPVRRHWLASQRWFSSRRSYRWRSRLGEDGEQFVLELERSRLEAAGQPELAEKVAWVSKEVGDGLGYDIESFEEDGHQIFIEVKTTKGPIDTPFYLTENERRVAADILMSAFGGKADVNHCVGECPLLAISGR